MSVATETLRKPKPRYCWFCWAMKRPRHLPKLPEKRISIVSQEIAELEYVTPKQRKV